MCEICRNNPCLSSCPNAPDPKPVARCIYCESPLYVGDKHFRGVCEDCLNDLTASEWLELIGEELETVWETE